jgi:general secretion pathway protein K
MEKNLNHSKGFALLLTLLIITLIVTATLQFHASMNSELYAAANLQDGAKLGCIAGSGFHYALAVLYEDAISESPSDSLREDWADWSALSANSATLFEDGRLEVRIIDHSGRIQINNLVQQGGEKQGQYNEDQKSLLKRFLMLEEFDLDEVTVDDLLDALKDWMDPDEETEYGAESSYYLMLERPYACKNRPLDFLEELLLVRGITRELFYGTDDKPGISGYLTTRGDGKININTADALVLRALSDDMDEELVGEMLAYREDEDNELNNVSWYDNVPGMSGITIKPSIITTSSSHFEIRSEGIKGAMSKRVKGFLEKKKDGVKILSWRLE